MRWIRRILITLIMLIVALVAVAFVLPREAVVARSITIDATPEAVFPHVNSMKNTEAWSPWMGRDPNIQISYEGPEMGEGNKLIWASEHPQVGNGTQTITASVENERVETALDFGSMGTADAYFDLKSVEGGTEITWGFSTDAGMNPMARWMGLMMDKWVGADYEAGLSNLKSIVEDS